MSIVLYLARKDSFFSLSRCLLFLPLSSLLLLVPNCFCIHGSCFRFQRSCSCSLGASGLHCCFLIYVYSLLIAILLSCLRFSLSHRVSFFLACIFLFACIFLSCLYVLPFHFAARIPSPRLILMSWLPCIAFPLYSTYSTYSHPGKHVDRVSRIAF